MSDKEAHVYTRTTVSQNIWLTTESYSINLGELRKAIAAADGMSDDAEITVNLRDVSGAVSIKRINISESPLTVQRIAKVQVVDQ